MHSTKLASLHDGDGELGRHHHDPHENGLYVIML